VQALLARVPTLTLLVTSRQLLGLTGEREFALKPLPDAPRRGHARSGCRLFDSVRLFIDRAQAAKPDFQVTAGNAPAIAALCDGLEGIPLALELAAARAQVLTPAQMLAGLDQRFGLLVSRKRDVSERQRTLKGAVEWSYRLLAPDLQRFFCRLSVFRGGWTAEAAEQVCEEPLALDHLAQLRECSLVLAETSAGDGEGDAMRFRMLETLREFGEGQLTAPEAAALAGRHASAFLALAERPFPTSTARTRRGGWAASPPSMKTSGWRSATAWTPRSEEDGLRLAVAVSNYWLVRGHLREARGFLDEALRRTRCRRRRGCGHTR
jgi:predicted ATPase